MLTQNFSFVTPCDDYLTRVVFLFKGRVERKRLTVVSRVNLDYDRRLVSAIRSALNNVSCAASEPIHTKIQAARETEAAHHPQIIVLHKCVACAVCIR